MSCQPNVLVVVLDTARYVSITERTAPGLHSIAHSGVEYTNAYSAAPWTLPSHASLFTGTYPSKHGAHADHKYLTDDLITLAEFFRAEGYETVCVSNNTWISEEFGFGRGFETFYKTWQYFQTDTDLATAARNNEGLGIVREALKEFRPDTAFTNLINALYGRFIRKRGDDGAMRTNGWIGQWLRQRETTRPFFLFVNYLEPHLEYRPPRDLAERFLPSDASYEEAMDVPQDAWSYIVGNLDLSGRDLDLLRGLYRAEIAYVDERVTQLKQMLKDAGKWEDTVIVVTGDHGENVGDHGLMDHQYCLYDTLLHVPLFVRGDSFTDGRTTDRLVQLVDIFPTLLDTAGIDASAARAQSQGVSFHPDACQQPREHAYGEYAAPQPSMDALEKRTGSIPASVYEYDRSLRTIRDDRYKLIRGSDGSRELYDISTDPTEETDLAVADEKRADALESELDEWLESFDHAERDQSVTPSRSTRNRLENLGYLE